MNPLDAYIHKHEKPLTILATEYVSVLVANGYVIFRDRRGGRDLYLSRKQLIALLPKLLRCLRKMDRSVNVERRMQKQAALELELLQERRQQKKGRVEDPERRRKQHQRWLRAQARAARRDD
jgi:hypothetical protein